MEGQLQNGLKRIKLACLSLVEGFDRLHGIQASIESVEMAFAQTQHLIVSQEIREYRGEKDVRLFRLRDDKVSCFYLRDKGGVGNELIDLVRHDQRGGAILKFELGILSEGTVNAITRRTFRASELISAERLLLAVRDRVK